MKQILSDLNSILGTSISNKKIESAIAVLFADGKITRRQGKYIISPSIKEKIDVAVKEFESRQKRIIERYFSPINTPDNIIGQWFEDVTIELFNEYGSEWISDLCSTTNGALKNKHKGIQNILDSVTSANKSVIKNDKEWLKNQYIKFLHSNDDDVISILWNYGTSRFSSSLIVANTSIDPITIEEFKNSKCILDTNILMYLDLEKGKYAESFKSMEKIFITLNILPVYLYPTRDEFIGAMAYKRDVIIRMVEIFPRKVIEATSDPFLQTALHRHCFNKEDFERFFHQLMEIPETFSELLDIKLIDNSEINEAIIKGQKNEVLKEKINKVYKKKWHYDKRKNALLHDAGLISAAELIRKKEKCFILSRDGSINEVALEKPLKNAIPIAIALNTLINLLAIDNGGTDIDPTDCAPLFASIIKLTLIPERDVFRLEDLSKVLDIETQIGSLDSHEIIDIAKEFHHNKVIGIPEEEIALQVNRRFQRAKLELQSNLETSKQETHLEREEKEKYFKRSDKAIQALKKKYTGELTDKYDSRLFWNRIWFFVVFPILGILIFSAIFYFKSEPETRLKNECINLSIHVIAWFILDFFFIDKKLRSKYSERINRIEEEVEKKIREDMQD